MKKWIYVVAGLSLMFTSVGCDSEEEPDPLDVIRVDDVPADPATGRDPNTGAPTGVTGRYTFFDLSSNQIILDREDDDRSDSTSTRWDIAFQSSNIIVNSSATGGGQGGVQVLDADFDVVDEAPTTGYTTERVGLESSSNLAWGTYDPMAMLVLPLSGKTLAIKTADGNYAKVRIVSYYKGAPDVPDAFADESRWYTFEYVYQPDGSNSFPQ
jgi:hypothetical protein